MRNIIRQTTKILLVCVFSTILFACGGGGGNNPPPPVPPVVTISPFLDQVIGVGDSTTATISLTNAQAYGKSLNVQILSSNSDAVSVAESNCTLTVSDESCVVSLTALTETANMHLTVTYDNLGTTKTINSENLYVYGLSWESVSTLASDVNNVYGGQMISFFMWQPSGISEYANNQWNDISVPSGVSFVDNNSVLNTLNISNNDNNVYLYSDADIDQTIESSDHQFIAESTILEAGLNKIGSNALNFRPQVLYVTAESNLVPILIYAGSESGALEEYRLSSISRLNGTWQSACGVVPGSITALTGINEIRLYAAVKNTGITKIYSCAQGGSWQNDDTQGIESEITSLSFNGNESTVLYAANSSKLWSYNLSTSSWLQISDGTIAGSNISTLLLSNGLNLYPVTMFAAIVLAGTENGLVWRYSFSSGQWVQVGGSLDGSPIKILALSMIGVAAVTDDDKFWILSITD